MINTVLVALASLAAAVAAQAPSTAGAPACLITCAQQYCNLTDLYCLCVTNITPVTECALSSCSAADIANASSIAAAECAAYSSGQVSVSGSSVAASVSSAAASAISSAESQFSSVISSVVSQASNVVASVTGGAATSASAAQAPATSSATSGAIGVEFQTGYGSLVAFIGLVAGVVAIVA